MKNQNLLIAFGACCLFVLLSVGCKQKSSPVNTNSAVGNVSVKIDDCLVGLWKATESNFTKTFEFKNDKSGTEVQSASDTRNFTWEIKDGKPVIKYTGEPTEWKFNLDCDKKELSVFGLVYKK